MSNAEHPACTDKHSMSFKDVYPKGQKGVRTIKEKLNMKISSILTSLISEALFSPCAFLLALHILQKNTNDLSAIVRLLLTRE